MRKTLRVAAVAVLAVMLAAPVMAMDFQFGGTTRVRFYDYSGLGYDHSQATNPGNNIRGADMFFRVTMTFSDDDQNIMAVLGLRWGKIAFGAGGGVENPVNFPSMQNWLNADTSGNIGYVTNPSVRAGASTGGGFGLRDINVEMEQAYLDFQVPWGIPLRIRMGGMPWYEPKGIIVDDNVMGVRGYGRYDIFNYQASWYRLDAGNRYGDAQIKTALGVTSRYRADSTDNNFDVFGFKLGATIAPWLNPAIYYYYGINDTICQPGQNGVDGGTTPYDNRGNVAGVGSTTSTQVVGPICPGVARQRPSWYIGLTDTGKLGDLSYDLDFVYGWAQGGAAGTYYAPISGWYGFVNGWIQSFNLGLPPSQPAFVPLHVRGWAFDAGAHYNWGPYTFNLVGSYASGDDGQGYGHSTAFPGGFSPAWNGPGGFFDLIGNGAPNAQFDIITATSSSMTGMWSVGGYLTYNATKAITLSAGYAFAGWTSKWANCAWAGDLSNYPGPPPAYSRVTGVNFPANGGWSNISASCYGPILFGKGYSNHINPKFNQPDGNNTTMVGKYLAPPSGGLVGAHTIGSEINLKADWQVYTGFKVQAVAAWLIPTVSGQNTVQKYVLQFRYDF